MLKRLSQPSGLFVSVKDVKAHTIVGFNEDDALIETYIRGATRLVEDRTGRILLPTEFEWLADKWGTEADIPVFPLREVTEVAYLDGEDVERTLLPAEWYSITTDRGFSVRYVSGFSTPTLSNRPQSVRVRFTAGYDDPDASGGFDLQADEMDRIIVMAIVAHWYSTREAVSQNDLSQVPMHAESMIAMRRIYR